MTTRQIESRISPDHPGGVRAHSVAGLTEPLLRLAPRAPLLALAGAAVAVLALTVAVTGGPTPALLLAVSAVTLLLVAVLAGVTGWMMRHRQAALGTAMARAFAQDPDPVIVTDPTGAVQAANLAAAAQPDPVARLDGWCVEPARVVASLLAETSRRGHAVRELWKTDTGLRVSTHVTDGDVGDVVWHFSPLAQGNRRGLDALGVAVLTREAGAMRANATAAALTQPGDGLEAALLGAETALRDRSGTSAPLLLPNMPPLQVHAVPARDGLIDFLLLPVRPAVADTLRAPAGHEFDEIPVALAQLDPEGRITGTNRLARTLLGLPADDSPFFWEVVEGLGRPVSDWLDDARAGRALGRPEVVRATQNGPETFVQIILRRAGAMQPAGALVAVISDATELKSLEARFVQSQKMQAIGQLAGGIAHDFNNLLTAISGHCDLLLLNRDRFDPDYSDLLQIHQNANRAAALVRQLLAFSRKQTLKAEVVALESLLEDLTHLLTRLVGERITLTLAHAPDLGAIRADKRQLEQVIMNLVVNARDAMPMGGTIRIETEAVRLDHDREFGRARVPPGDYALIRVIDRGVGIPADIVDKIFEPFFTTKRVGEGTGLGLSTAYGIVKQMGGYIFCDSVEGAGTVFTLYFAVESRQRDGKAQESRPETRARTTTTLQHDAPGVAGAGCTTASGWSRGGDGDAADDTTPDDDADVTPVIPAQVSLPGTRHTADVGSAAVAPRPSPPPKADRVAVAAIPAPLKGGAILLVEDEAPVRAFAARALRMQGYQVFEAQDGEQALEFLDDPAIRVDLFVTDVIMPGIDGPGWVSKALRNRPGTPVVFVSGYTEDTLSAALVRIPRAVFLGKPFSLRDLSATISQQLAA